MRENLMELFLPLIAEELNFEIKKATPLVDKQATTLLRETDSFLLIETNSEEEPKFILHLEFESKDDKEMIFRMSEYHGIELRKHRLPIKHVVVYLGEKLPQMRTKLQEEEIFTGFRLVNVGKFTPEKWLSEEHPARIIMAILADYPKGNAKFILEAILAKLRQVCTTTADLKKFIAQLTFLSRMRNLERLTIKISETMPVSLDVESSYLYQLGLKKAEEMLLQAKDAANKAKATANKAKAKIARLEKEKLEVTKEKEKLEAKAAKVKAELKAKVKAELEAKAKAELEAKIVKEKASIYKMRLTKRFSDEEIVDFLNLDMKTFKKYLKEIIQEQEQEDTP